MRKKLFLSLVAVLLFAPVAYGLTAAQEEHLNNVGAPSSIAAASQVQLGQVVEALVGGGGKTTQAADVLAVPVRDGDGNPYSTILKTTGSDAEAMTLANGDVGQILTVHLNVDGGGDGTITPATTGGDFASCVLADAGDSVTYRYIDSTAGWVVVGTANVSGSPVCAKS